MKKAFTLAEVLITLGIIGIVAAMTLPVVIGNYQKKVTAAKVKKFWNLGNISTGRLPIILTFIINI